MIANREFIISTSIPAKNNRDLAEDSRIREKYRYDLPLAFFFLEKKCTNGDKHR